MARPLPTPMNCPQCGQPFQALLERLIDVARDPDSKRRLLSGRTNLITCPNCGFQGQASTPLAYHDHSKELFIVFTPMEINVGKEDRERMLGDMARDAMNSLPEDASKGYLLQPKTALTMQGLMDLVLEGDGITKEDIADQQAKLDLIRELAEMSPEEQDTAIAEHADSIDLMFFDLLSMLAQAASQEERPRDALRMFNLRKKLMDMTDVGQEVKVREAAATEAQQELQALGQQATREDIVELLVNAAGNKPKVEAFASMLAPALDYTMFQAITDRIDAAEEGEHKQNLTDLRETLLRVRAAVEQQQRQVVEQANQTLNMLARAADIPAAVRENVHMIDDTLITVLQAAMEDAQRSGQLDAATRLRRVYEEILKLIQESAPPEVQFIQALLQIPDEAEALQALRDRQAEISDEVLAVMGQLVGQLQESGQDAVALRLAMLLDEAMTLVGN